MNTVPGLELGPVVDDLVAAAGDLWSGRARWSGPVLVGAAAVVAAGVGR